MKLVVWLVLLFVVAVVAAMTLGANDGLASFYWRGWRLDLSLNFFIMALLGAFIGLSTSVRLTRWLIGLPARAKAWRTERREQALQSAQRQALLESFAARYSRAVKAARPRPRRSTTCWRPSPCTACKIEPAEMSKPAWRRPAWTAPWLLATRAMPMLGALQPQRA
jgi:uncharacterized protein HemY